MKKIMKNLIFALSMIVMTLFVSSCEKEEITNVSKTQVIQDGIYYHYGSFENGIDTIYQIDSSNVDFSLYNIINQNIVSRFYIKPSTQDTVCWNPYVMPIGNILIIGIDSLKIQFTTGNGVYITKQKPQYPIFNTNCL